MDCVDAKTDIDPFQEKKILTKKGLFFTQKYDLQCKG
jgi:hypothetical protein